MQQGTQTDVVRLLILDDHALFREGMARLLEVHPDLTIAAACGTITEAIQALGRVPADLILLDCDLGNERGADFILRAREHGTDVPILVITAGVSDREALSLIRDGVAGIFPKTEPPEALVDAIRQIVAGGTWFNARHRDLAAGARVEGSGMKTLSPRERLVLRGVVDGLANKEIGARLEISESSVKAALQQLFFKTGVRTRSQLVRVALERYPEAVL